MKFELNKDIFNKNDKSIENKKVRIITSIFIVVMLVLTYIFLNFNNIMAVYTSNKSSENINNMKILLGGDAVGIKLLATGVLVMGMDRDDTDLRIGDVILKVNEQKVESNLELLNFAKISNGNELSLEVSRKNDIFNTTIVPIKDEVSNEYKLGLWVKDSSAGVGTITFYEKKSNRFVALGHGVTETKENYILPIESGGITLTNIYSIKKGIAKVPGELKGTISNNVIGDIKLNNDKGIYGEMLETSMLQNKKEIEIMPKSKIKEGEASIFCTLDENKVREYKIQIQKVLLSSDGNKNMIIKITDKELITKTGGIVQGMSGSPIVQDGKLIGAITHVFLNDPTRGYGVFIENMIDSMNSIS